MDDTILLLIRTVRVAKAQKLKAFYLYTRKNSFIFREAYLTLIIASVISLLCGHLFFSTFCLSVSFFFYFSPTMAKKLLERTRKNAIKNSLLLPCLIKKHHSDYKLLRTIKLVAPIIILGSTILLFKRLL